MKRNIFIILALVSGLSLWAQPRLTSNKETHNFGQIEWKKPVTVEYTITNSGTEPLVLTNVTTSCACAVTGWTQTPIPPGEKGIVTATFDAKALGRFHKTVGIYSNANPNLVYLKFIGEVVTKVTEIPDSHEYTSIGQILTDRTEIDFPDVHRGDRPVITMNVINQSDRPYEPILMHLPPFLIMEKEPAVLQKGERGTIKLTLDTDRISDLGMVQTSVYLARFTGDKVNEENEIPVSAVLLPDFSVLTEAERLNAPAITLSETDVDFTEELSRKDKVSRNIVITNTGKSPLQIKNLQVSNPALRVNLSKTVLKPGKSTKLKLSLRKKNMGKKKNYRILLITNDPVNPKMDINIKTASTNQ